MSIPNEEVRKEFVNAVTVSGWKEVVEAIDASKKLLENTLNGNSEAVARMLDSVHGEAASGLTYNNENSLACAITYPLYPGK